MPRNKGRVHVDLAGDWSRHTDAVPCGGIALGTVTLGDVTGALVRLDPVADADSAFLMITADGLIHHLNPRKVRAALQQAQHPTQE